MIHAYDRNYLEKAQTALGRMLDYAVYSLNYNLADFWKMFLNSYILKYFEAGEVSVVAGRSGVELALMVAGIDKDYPEPIYTLEKSQEYWAGWALAYFQWNSCISFSQLAEVISINEIVMMYSPYHEMDVLQFCDRISGIYNDRNLLTNLKRRRLSIGLSQSKLAESAGIPLRTIQQYEQGQKNINKARAEYLISLSRALYCDPQLLMENTRYDIKK